MCARVWLGLLSGNVCSCLISFAIYGEWWPYGFAAANLGICSAGEGCRRAARLGICSSSESRDL